MYKFKTTVVTMTEVHVLSLPLHVLADITVNALYTSVLAVHSANGHIFFIVILLVNINISY